MKKLLPAIAAVCNILLLLCCCDASNASLYTTEKTSVWETMPALKWETLEYEKLEKMQWNSGRLEATSNYMWAETADGYYFLHSGILRYADKKKPDNWYSVCNKPDCEHAGASGCNAFLGSNSFIIQDGRIWFSSASYNFPELYLNNGYAMGIFSKGPDGSDTKLEYIIEDAIILDAGEMSALLTPAFWQYDVVRLNSDGSSTGTVYHLTANGLEVLSSKTADNLSARVVPDSISGDFGFYNDMLASGINSIVRMVNGSPVITDVSGYYDTACYLSGNYLRIYRPNDGYYDVDLITKKEFRIADNHLKNAKVFMPLPNCIIETTVGSSLQSMTEENAMQIYNGSQWQKVELPEELQLLPNTASFTLAGVSSDSIFFVQRDMLHCNVYRLLISEDTFVLESLGKA